MRIFRIRRRNAQTFTLIFMAHKNLLLLHFDITFDRNFSNLYHMFSLNSAIYTTLTLGLKPCKKAENAKQCFLFPEAFTGSVL